MDNVLQEFLQFLEGFWRIVGQMSPYLLFGFLIAGVLNELISPAWVERHLGGRGPWPIIKASAFGVPLPLCSCGVIPVAASLRRHGASRGATTAFLISTPQTGVDSLVVTFSLLGPVYAVFRPVVALISGIVGGGIADAIEPRDTEAAKADACQDECCTDSVQRHWLIRIFHYGFVVLARDIGRALLIGLVVAALISSLVPPDFFVGKLGGVLAGGIGAMLIMMALGIPIYVCATASVPVAAALITKGVSPGAALVFLMTGPATNAATIATVWKTMGPRTAGVYLLTVAGMAVGSGLLLDALFDMQHWDPKPVGMEMIPMWLQIASAVVLLAVIVLAMVRRPSPGDPDDHSADEAAHDHDEPGSASVTVDISGMTCSHCADAVRRALLESPGIRSVNVDLRAGQAVIIGGDLDENTIRQAVESLGYTVAAIVSTPAGARKATNDQ
ncbi:hypothetical protein LCGC14_0401920 [marine sediment metagenome]|uniref:HMA domain-containing protein n=1 Tax=marine sediment metagenome TaxID=412755 RepID=A0A0F9VIH2_9ZZZZ|nr:hypothetical protein [Phycisphaerae bacterium]HDZ42873.1 hypothetical protein [Phycisphaerae bacterium]